MHQDKYKTDRKQVIGGYKKDDTIAFFSNSNCDYVK